MVTGKRTRLGKFNFVDLSGQTFGDFTCLWPEGRRSSPGRIPQIVWLCACVCGRVVHVRGGDLRVKSKCGCKGSTYAHGHAMRGKTTPEYRAYIEAKTRCTNPNRRCSKRYQDELGVRFLFASFEEFYAELGDKPEPKRAYSVERIDNKGPYGPGNVKWATRSEQSLNREPYKFSHCRKGHELSPENTITTSSTTRRSGIERRCRICAVNAGRCA